MLLSPAGSIVVAPTNLAVKESGFLISCIWFLEGTVGLMIIVCRPAFLSRPLLSCFSELTSSALLFEKPMWCYSRCI